MPDFLSPDLLRNRSREFEDPGVAAGYRDRPIYPSSLMSTLRTLIDPTNRTVLDVGTGTGNVARPLAPFVDRIDAVDPSPAMIEVGKQLPGGDNSVIQWRQGRIEEFEGSGEYGLITCGLSIHFLDQSAIIPLFHRLLAPGRYLAALSVSPERTGWDDDVEAVRGGSVSTGANEDQRAFDRFKAEGLLTGTGSFESESEPWNPTIDTYINNLRGRSSWSILLADKDRGNDMLNKVRAILERNAVNGRLPITIRGRLWWGIPTPKS